MVVNPELKKYIEEKIYPLYNNNYNGDNLERVEYVLNRGQKIISENGLIIDDNILFAAIAYHDLRKNTNEKDHEKISAEIMFNDKILKKYFSDKERIIIKEAIEDQRAKMEKEPRSIYGKILSSASRNSSVEQCLRRSYNYGKKINPDATDEEIFEGSYKALVKKFGKDGYAKFYFKDSTYEKFLKELRDLLSNKEEFIKVQKNIVKN